MFFDKILDYMNMDNWENGSYHNKETRKKDAHVATNLIIEAERLDKIINTTCDETDFWINFEKLFSVLTQLLDYDYLDIFDKSPHELLKQTTDNREYYIQQMQLRIHNKNKSPLPPASAQLSVKTHAIKTIKEKCSDSTSEKFVSDRIIINGVSLYFTSIARDVVNQNKVDELYLKRTYSGLNSDEYNKIIQQLKDARIIDDNQNVIMKSDTIEHFLDIYEPSIFKCENSSFDKDIFMCLGEIIIENGFNYAKSCFPSIDELLDYLKIMEKLKILRFTDGKYEVLCSTDEFHDICKGVPEFYSSLESAIPSRQNISCIDFDKISGHEFEHFCANILLKNDFKNVTITKASCDHGVDIFAEKDGNSYAIQCKCYRSNVGNSAIQEVLSGKNLYRKDLAVVLTNQYFTAQAKKEADALGVKLWDRNKLIEMVEKSK